MTLRLAPRDIVVQSTSPLLTAADWWERCRLGDVATVTNGAAFKSARFNTLGEGLPLIRIRDVGQSKASTYYGGDYEDRHLVEPGDLLIGMDGDFRIARWTGGRALLNQRVCRLRVRDSDLYCDRFLEYVLQPYLDEIHKVTSSVTVKHLSSRTVTDLPIPLPPRAEQDRIVAAIEEHFSRLAAVEFTLQRGLQRLRTLRSSVLVETFYSNRGLPSHWSWTTIGDVAEVRGGIQKQPKRRPNRHPAPFLRVANVLRGELLLDEVHEIELFDGELERARLQAGDLLVVEGNGSPQQIGRAASWSDEIADCVHQNHLIRVRPGPSVVPRYLALYWNAPHTASVLRAVASSTSGLYTLSTAKVKSVPIPLAPLPAQRSIVEEVDQQLETCSRLEQSMCRALDRLRVVRRSVFAVAFSGQLVPQDPSDEHASLLLERIAASRSTKPNRRASARQVS